MKKSKNKSNIKIKTKTLRYWSINRILRTFMYADLTPCCVNGILDPALLLLVKDIQLKEHQ